MDGFLNNRPKTNPNNVTIYTKSKKLDKLMTQSFYGVAQSSFISKRDKE